MYASVSLVRTVGDSGAGKGGMHSCAWVMKHRCDVMRWGLGVPTVPTLSWSSCSANGTFFEALGRTGRCSTQRLIVLSMSCTCSIKVLWR